MTVPQHSSRSRQKFPESQDGGQPSPQRESGSQGAGAAWQLEMFEYSLKKRQKLALLLRMLGPLNGQRCLLVTCGDNSGALNFHLRAHGGKWVWGELEEEGIPEIARLLGEPVHAATPQGLPFDDGAFDRVVTIDVHEHLDDPAAFNREVARVLAPDGAAVLTTPGGNPWLPVAILKRLLGMSPAVYGHRTQGFTHRQLEEMAADVGLEPMLRGAYSRFFTEAIELGINFLYVKVLGKGRKGTAPEPAELDASPDASPGEDAAGIAPTTQEELENVGGSYGLYRRLFPLLRAVASLDHLIPGRGGYAVALAARKPGRQLRLTPTPDGPQADPENGGGGGSATDEGPPERH